MFFKSVFLAYNNRILLHMTRFSVFVCFKAVGSERSVLHENGTKTQRHVAKWPAGRRLIIFAPPFLVPTKNSADLPPDEPGGEEGKWNFGTN